MIGAHAVVLGASIAGLLAARVLAEHYRAVTVMERDELPEAAANRRGVPQGHDAHGQLGRGSLILADLFPGFEDELLEAGVPAFDYRDLSRASFFLAGHHAPTAGAFSTVPPLYFSSRPLLESLVRRRVRAMGGAAGTCPAGQPVGWPTGSTALLPGSGQAHRRGVAVRHRCRPQSTRGRGPGTWRRESPTAMWNGC
jgi:2-polyprenyl-6-methoxyphenol hydroxylase-like FAD-dependent oxidoreductase